MSCISNLNNLARTCQKNLGQITYAFTSPSDFEIAFADVNTESSYTDLINAALSSRLYVIHPVDAFDATSEKEDDTINTGNTGIDSKAVDGKQKLMFTYDDLPLSVAEAMKGLDNSYMYTIFGTSNEYLISSKNATGMKPVKTQVFVGSPVPSESFDNNWKVTIEFSIVPRTNYFTFATNPYEVNDWKPSELNGIDELTVGDTLVPVVKSASVTDSEVIVEMINAYDGTPYEGLVTETDFVIKLVSDGSEVVPSAMTSVGNEYTLTAVLTVDAYTIERKAANLATDKGVEMNTPVEFTPVA